METKPQQQRQQSKPTKSFEQFLNKYVAKATYIKTKQGKIVMKRGAPRILVKTLKSLDSKSLKEGLQDKLAELRSKLNVLPQKDAKGRKAIEDQIKALEAKQSRLYDNTINLQSFEFMKDFINAKGDSSKILDAELRGYLEILGDKVDKEVFKQLVSRFHFDTTKTKNYSEVIKSIIKNDKYKLKIFNATFTHPDMKDKAGKVVMRKIGTKEAEEPMKLYMKRMCKYFDTVLKLVIKGEEDDTIIFNLIQKLFKDELKKSFSEEDYEECQKEIVKGQKVNKEVRRAHGLYKSLKSTIDELREYPKLKEEFKSYDEKVKELEKIADIKFKCSTNQELLQSFADVLKELKEFDLHEMVFNEFMKAVDYKFKPDVKKRFMECSEKGKKIKVVEQEFEADKKGKQIKKKMEFSDNEFLEDDVNILEPAETIYDSEKYNRMGNLVDVKVSKVWHVALCLRLISEIKKIVAEGQIKGQQQFVILF